jgi:hypothetical protein
MSLLPDSQRPRDRSAASLAGDSSSSDRPGGLLPVPARIVPHRRIGGGTIRESSSPLPDQPSSAGRPIRGQIADPRPRRTRSRLGPGPSGRGDNRGSSDRNECMGTPDSPRPDDSHPRPSRAIGSAVAATDAPSKEIARPSIHSSVHETPRVRGARHRPGREAAEGGRHRGW